MAGPQRKPVNKKKILPVKKTRVANVDYKDVNLLKKFISEREDPCASRHWAVGPGSAQGCHRRQECA